MDLEKTPQRLVDDLRSATEEMRAFSENTPPPAPISDAQIKACVSADTAQGTIILDHDGFPPNARAMIFGQAREYLQAADSQRRSLLDRFQPFESMRKDAEAIPLKISALEAERDQRIGVERANFEADEVGETYLNLKGRYEHQVEIHPHQPNLKAVSSWFPFDVNPSYLLLMTLLGVAEWFINYDTLFLFFGVPVIAVGATIVLAVSLSVVAHQHGLDLKQWKKKFGPAVHRKNMPYGILILASLGLAAILMITGWMRYQAVMGTLQSTSTANILGTQFQVRIDPQREVIISLGSNLLAWLAGVFISYFAHDSDEVYVRTAVDYLKAKRKFEKKKAVFDSTADQIRHQYADETDQQKHRLQKFDANPFLKEALSLRDQIEQYDLGFKERAKSYIISQYSKYRSELILAFAANKSLTLVRRGTNNIVVTLTPNELRNLEFGVADELLGPNKDSTQAA